MILISLAFLSTFVLYLAMEIQYILEVLGTGFFAISGALAANDKDFAAQLNLNCVGK